MIEPLDSVLADELLAGQLDLMRFEAHVRVRVLAILTRLQRELVGLLAGDELTAFSKVRTETLLKQTKAVIDRYYTTAAAELSGAMASAAQASASNAGSALGSAFSVQLAGGLPTETFLARIVSNVLLQGAASADWWSRQQSDIAFRFANAVRQGIVAGETNEEIAIRIAGSTRKGVTGVMEVARSNARSLVHTSIQAVANAARLETLRKNSRILKSVVWLATLDGSTCPEICGPRDLKEYTLMDDPPQPIGHALDWNGGPGAVHWGCRCVVTGKRKTFAELGDPTMKEPPPMTRASIYGPVSGNTNFEQFLNRRGKKFQEDVLGKGRAQLWRDGKLTLQQLLDLRGNPLSLEQLQAKYG